MEAQIVFKNSTFLLFPIVSIKIPIVSITVLVACKRAAPPLNDFRVLPVYHDSEEEKNLREKSHSRNVQQ